MAIDSANPGKATDFRASEANRRIENLIRLGRVAAVDYTAGRARVTFPDLESAWLKWLAARSGPDRDWCAPEVGEQVLVAATSGELSQGLILGALASRRNPNVGDVKTQRRTVFADGTVIEYDRALRVLSVFAPNQIALQAFGQITLIGDVVIEGNLQVTGAIRAEHQIVSSRACWPPVPATTPRIPVSRRYRQIERPGDGD